MILRRDRHCRCAFNAPFTIGIVRHALSLSSFKRLHDAVIEQRTAAAGEIQHRFRGLAPLLGNKDRAFVEVEPLGQAEAMRARPP